MTAFERDCAEIDAQHAYEQHLRAERDYLFLALQHATGRWFSLSDYWKARKILEQYPHLEGFYVFPPGATMKVDFAPALKALVEQHSLNDVLEKLEEICTDKALEYPHDEDLAETWREAADALSYILRTSIPGDI
jgi:hypothetical protein